MTKDKDEGSLLPMGEYGRLIREARKKGKPIPLPSEMHKRKNPWIPPMVEGKASPPAPRMSFSQFLKRKWLSLTILVASMAAVYPSNRLAVHLLSDEKACVSKVSEPEEARLDRMKCAILARDKALLSSLVIEAEDDYEVEGVAVSSSFEVLIKNLYPTAISTDNLNALKILDDRGASISEMEYRTWLENALKSGSINSVLHLSETCMFGISEDNFLKSLLRIALWQKESKILEEFIEINWCQLTMGGSSEYYEGIRKEVRTRKTISELLPEEVFEELTLEAIKGKNLSGMSALIRFTSIIRLDEDKAKKFLTAAAETNDSEFLKLVFDQILPRVLDQDKPKVQMKFFELAIQKGYTDLLDSFPEAFAESELSALLLVSARYGRSDIIQKFVGKGAQIEAENGAGQTPLILAVESGNQTTVQLLLNLGAEVNIFDSLESIKADQTSLQSISRTPLMHAAERGHLNIAELLVENGAEVDASSGNKKTALIYAAENGHLEIARALLDAGADINSQLKKSEASNLPYESYEEAASDAKKISKSVVINKGGIYLIISESGIVVRRLITETHGKTALGYAVSKGHTKIAKLLIEHGADVNLGEGENLEERLSMSRPGTETKISSVTKTLGGVTPIVYAVASGQTEIVDLLLKKGAIVEVQDANSKTPLLTSAENNRVEILNLLLKKGAQVNVKDPDGKTPLIHAAEKNHLEIARLLLEAGADTSPKDGTNRSALNYAYLHEDGRMVDLLKEHESK